MTPFAEIKNARVYRGENIVFENLNLNFFLKQNTAILGPNGAGKTSLFKLITREISPRVSPGSHIKLFGEVHTNIWQLRKKIGIISHEYQSNYQTLASGEEVVLSAFFGSVGVHGHHRIEAAQRQKAKNLMQSLGLQTLADKPYLQLSFGQQRRLLLARALVHDPEVLIFDEPTVGLDLGSSMQIIREIRQLSATNKTILLITHHLQELVPEIQRVIMLKNGQVFKDGDKQTVVTSKNVSQLFDVAVEIQCQSDCYIAAPSNKHLAIK
ncbi:MAG: ATP-binding cassette domain-containing protein [Cellvibrionaceae bacterium]|nr:ATP-binding cassette domain-containing protein [Cellvibrionaceae bacterium]